jgi:hypothetical protein
VSSSSFWDNVSLSKGGVMRGEKKAEERPCGKVGLEQKSTFRGVFSHYEYNSYRCPFPRKQREEIIQEVQKQMQEAASQALKQVLRACLEAEVTAKLGREKGEPRRASAQEREIDWKCGHGGSQNANQ